MEHASIHWKGGWGTGIAEMALDEKGEVRGRSERKEGWVGRKEVRLLAQYSSDGREKTQGGWRGQARSGSLLPLRWASPPYQGPSSPRFLLLPCLFIQTQGENEKEKHLGQTRRKRQLRRRWNRKTIEHEH